MDHHLPSQHTQPRSTDQSRFYAEWAVRRIGRAFAIATFGPIVLLFAVVFLAPGAGDAADVLLYLGSAAIIAGAILSLCFARAPR